MSDGWVGIVGVLVGGAITFVVQKAQYARETKQARERDDGRRKLLRQMLDNAGPGGWRELETLARVIGATPDETARLLIEIGARGSESGNNVWGYVERHPLPAPRD